MGEKMSLKISDMKRIEIEKYEYMAEVNEKDICIFINHNMTTVEESTLKRVMEKENYYYFGIIANYSDNKAVFLFSKKSDEVKH